MKIQTLRIGGMTCANCQNKIEKKLRRTAGVKSADVSYSAGTAAVTYDDSVITMREIEKTIEKLNYTVLSADEGSANNISRAIGILIIIFCLYALLQQFGILNLLVPSKLADTKMGYGMLFVIGIVTSLHCVAMCGGINLSQSIPRGGVSAAAKKSRMSAFAPALLYNLGRVISYTVIGFVLGFVSLLLGSGADAGLPQMPQGILKLIAGVFMVIMGINMLGIFPWLRKLNLRMPNFLVRKADVEKSKSNSPLIVGLLNGLMPCGPLQSMQLVALVSGNPFAGALSMFLFSMGTVPMMLGLGSIVAALGKKFAQKVLTVGAVLVVVLGLAMLSQGGSLLGFSFGGDSGNAAPVSDVQIVDGKQVVNSTLTSGVYPNITVQAGTPVKWIIDAPEENINGCNYRMLIDNFGIEHSFEPGENVIEFTPTKTGTIQYTCWMGMIRGSINIVEKAA